MLTRRIIVKAASIRKAISWNAPPGRCRLATAAEDPGRKLWDGTAKIDDLSTPELKQALDHRNIAHGDCFDKESLQKRLAGCMVDEYKNAQQKEETNHQGADVKMDPFLLKTAIFFMHIPWRTFALSKEIAATDKSLLLMVPAWEYDRVAAEFRKRGEKKDPSVALRQYDFLVRRSAGLHGKRDPREDAPIGTAALLLYFHGHGEHIQEVDASEMGFEGGVEEYSSVVPFLNPVPKNWAPKIPPSSRDLEGVMAAIECARKVAGECEPIGPP